MPKVHLLDLGSVAQIFFEAKSLGLNCEIEYCTTETHCTTSINVPLGKLKIFSEIKLNAGDFIIIPSSLYTYVLSDDFNPSPDLINWMNQNYNNGINFCSLSNSALLLAKAELLNGIYCTTHWLRIDKLKELAPKSKVIENILFYEDSNIITSAGAISCIDCALHIVSKLGGGKMAFEISKKLLLYNIRKGNEEQISIHLKFREHTHKSIHKVQDFLSDNLKKTVTLLELSEIANMSERSLTRIFKKETKLTIKEYLTELRIEKANQLMKIPDYSIIQIANECGLQSERHLRRILKKK